MQLGLRSTAFTGILTITLALCACGGSSSTSQSSSATAASTPQASSTSGTETSGSGTSTASSGTHTASSSKATSEKTPEINVNIASPIKLEPIARRFTCDGADISPPISWSHIPANTKEIDLFLLELMPVHGKFVTSWAVAGLSPKLRSLSAGHLPAGAILGRNSHGRIGYSLCPAKGPSRRSLFALYALPKKIPAHPGFVPETLRETVLHQATSSGLLGLTYKRR